MASPDSKPPPSPRMGFSVPPDNPNSHGFGNPPPYNPYPPGNASPPSGAPYPPSGAPHSPSGTPHPPSGAPYPPSEAPYPPSGAPHSPSGAPHPPSGAPYPPSGAPNPPSGAPYPPSGAPHSPSGAPHPPSGALYPPSGAPYPPSGAHHPPTGDHLYPTGPDFRPPSPAKPSPYPPSSDESSHPGSPGFNTSGDPLLTGFKPGYPPGQPVYLPGQPGYPPGYPGGQPGYPGGPPGYPAGHPSDDDHVPKDENGVPLFDEEATVKGFEFSDKNIRRQFIKKVYAILMLQLLLTFGFVALCLFHKGIQEGVARRPELIWVSIGVVFATIIPMVCCESARRTFPVNFILLLLFTSGQAFMIGMVTTRYQEESVVIALGMTAVVCLSLTLFAFQTKYDFTTMGGVLLVLLVVLIIMGFIMPFYGGEKVRILYSALGTILFSFYLIYDTQLIIGGNHKMSISPEEYIFAALNIYLDVINLFLHILAILGKKK